LPEITALEASQAILVDAVALVILSDEIAFGTNDLLGSCGVS
jgi:hypothetical protein